MPRPLAPLRALPGAASLVLLVALAATPARSAVRRAPAWRTPARVAAGNAVAPLVTRMDRYLQQHEVDGVTMDWRYDVSPSEEIRQTVVCQLLAYNELYRLQPRPRVHDDIVQHADFMIGRLADIRSYTPFDGMLAYALLGAWEATHETRFLTVGTQVTNDLLAIPTEQCVLNGGLMLAMATAEYAHLTGDAAATQKTSDILGLLGSYQNADGSFPHWCPGSRDIHYTGWMAMELIHLDRLTGDARIPGFLSSMTGFLAGRIGADGRAIYEQPCAGGPPGCMEYFYSRATGCGYDYDSRGWTVEPAYCVLAFDRMASAKLAITLQFLLSLESGGTFKDLYAYWPPPSDPEYPWTIADTSVVNMSIIFWAMATVLTDRVARGTPETLVLYDDTLTDAPPTAPGAPGALALSVGPNPARGPCTLRFTLPHADPARIDVCDAGGRRVRGFPAEWRAPGPHAVPWDGLDDAGRPAPSGVYWARVVTRDGARTARFALVR